MFFSRSLHSFTCLVIFHCVYVYGSWIETEWKTRPYMVSIRDSDGHLCGGSIISKSNNDGKGIILTAANCILPINMLSTEIAIGCTNTICTEEEDNPSVYKITGYLYHPGWNPRSDELKDDILLLELESSISHPLSTKILLESNINLVEENDNIICNGYGVICEGGSSANVLEYVIMRYQSQSECDDTWGEFIEGDHDFCLLDEDLSDAEDTICAGDSGSPLILAKNSKQIGLVSLISDSTLPTIGTYIPYYYEWIKGVINDDSMDITTTSSMPTQEPTNAPNINIIPTNYNDLLTTDTETGFIELGKNKISTQLSIKESKDSESNLFLNDNGNLFGLDTPESNLIIIGIIAIIGIIGIILGTICCLKRKKYENNKTTGKYAETPAEESESDSNTEQGDILQNEYGDNDSQSNNDDYEIQEQSIVVNDSIIEQDEEEEEEDNDNQHELNQLD